MNKLKIAGLILAISFGIFMVVYGERDDSPGGQLLGLLAVIISIAGIVKINKKTSESNS